MDIKINRRRMPKMMKANLHQDEVKESPKEEEKEISDNSPENTPEEKTYHLNAGGLQLTGKILYKDVSRNPRGMSTPIYYLDDFGFTQSKDKEEKTLLEQAANEDVIDNSDMPNIVVLSIESALDDIQETLPQRENNNKNELAHLVEDIVSIVTVNSNYNDNLLDLVEMYLQNLAECPEKRIAQDLFGRLMLNIGDSIVTQLKSHRLFSLDDSAYYQFDELLSPMLIVLRKVDPRDFLGMD